MPSKQIERLSADRQFKGAFHENQADCFYFSGFRISAGVGGFIGQLRPEGFKPRNG
jgi:hypothetical protein